MALGLLPACGHDANSQPVLQVTPSGNGDPAAIICRAPQRLSDPGAFGPKICARNSVWAELAAHGKDLGADGKTIIDRPMVDNPIGAGAPEAVTCRKPQDIGPPMPLHARHHLGPEFCQTNQFWARIQKYHETITASGVLVTDLGDMERDLRSGW
jgi:hypothetical protein